MRNITLFCSLANSFLNSPLDVYIALAQKYAQEKTPQMQKHILIRDHLYLVACSVKPYTNRCADKLRLIEEGNIGLFEAAERYSAEKHGAFPVYATWWIRQSILKGLQKEHSSITLVEKAAELTESTILQTIKGDVYPELVEAVYSYILQQLLAKIHLALCKQKNSRFYELKNEPLTLQDVCETLDTVKNCVQKTLEINQVKTFRTHEFETQPKYA